MFQLKLLPQDLKEQAALQRRRALEDERRARILDPKKRIIGIDQRGLERQLEEKARVKENARSEERKYHQNQMNMILKADEMEKLLSERRKRLSAELSEFWRTRQEKSGDERQLKVPDPADLGVSSGQIFEGEDPDKGRREREQRVQNKTWLAQQIAERRATREEERLAYNIFQDCLSSRDSRGLLLEAMERDCTRQIKRATQAYNLALARENAFNRKIEKEKEYEDNLLEVLNTGNSDFLLESREVSASQLGRGRVIPSQYKGMSEEERLAIRQTQLRQIQQNKVNREAENSNLQKWERFYKSVDDLLVSSSDYQHSVKREHDKSLMEDNKYLSRVKKAQNIWEMKRAASNFTTPEFMSKFNQSSR